MNRAIVAMIPTDSTLSDLRASWVADLDRVARRDRWGRAILAIGWVHLAFFGGCHLMHEAGDRREWHYVLAWLAEIAAVVATMAILAGPGWIRSTPLAGIVGRIWGTVLILSFNLASMNSLMGLDHEWFKPVLCTLASFGFMMMAYLVHRAFFLSAVQMYFTGLIMVAFPRQSYLIHGLSWWLGLMVVGGSMEMHRRRSGLRHEVYTVQVGPPATTVRPILSTGRWS